MNEAEVFALNNDITEVVNSKDKRAAKMVVMRLQKKPLQHIGDRFGISKQTVRIALYKIFKKSKERVDKHIGENVISEYYFDDSELEKLKVAAVHISKCKFSNSHKREQNEQSI